MMSSVVERQVVLVLHSEPIVALGLQSALAAAAGFDARIVAAPGAVAQAGAVIVCDDGVVSSVLRHWPGTPVVVLARQPREFEIQQALERGVLGYVVTSCRVDEIEEAVRAASGGRHFLCRAAAEEMASGFATESLTLRERDVLALLARGCCNKTIASELRIALGTVKAHVRAIMAKLKATSRTEAASIASARGLVCNVDAAAQRRIGSARMPAGPAVAGEIAPPARGAASSARELAA